MSNLFLALLITIGFVGPFAQASSTLPPISLEYTNEASQRDRVISDESVSLKIQHILNEKKSYEGLFKIILNAIFKSRIEWRVQLGNKN